MTTQATQKTTESKKTTTEKPKSKVLDSIIDKMGAMYSIPAKSVIPALRSTALLMDDGKPETNEAEIISILSAATKYDLDPFLREIYAFRTKKGVIIPVVGFDGWIKIMNNNPKYKGHELEYSENLTTIGKSKECFEWIEISIYVEGLEVPVKIREYLDECYISRSFDTSPWNSHTKRMLRHKTFIQGIRVAFNISGIYDKDEAQRIDIAEAPTIDPEKTEDTKKDKPKATKATKKPASKPVSKPAPKPKEETPIINKDEPPINELYDDSAAEKEPAQEQETTTPAKEKEKEKPQPIAFW